MTEWNTVWLNHQLQLARQGKVEAWNPVIEQCQKRLETMAHSMLAGFPRVRRWEETLDIVQRSVLRLMRALQDVRVDSTRAFFGLAATQIRRELLDLARHYNGPEGLGANFNSGFHGKVDDDSPREMQPVDELSGRQDLADWARLHETVETLEAEEREVFSLVFYHGWTQPQIAELFQVDERTIRRRWRAVCLTLQEKLGGDFPGSDG